MYKLNRWKKTPGILQSFISGTLLIGRPSIHFAASAIPISTLKSCSGIYED